MVSLSGVRAGGIASGLSKLEELDLQRETVAATKEKTRFESLKTLADQGQAQIDTFLGQAEAIAERGSANPQVMDLLSRLKDLSVQTAVQVELTGARPPGYAQSVSASFDAAVGGVKTPEEKGAIAATEEVSKEKATAANLPGGKRFITEVDEQGNTIEIDQLTGDRNVLSQAKTSSVKNYAIKDNAGNIIKQGSVDLNDNERVQSLINQGAQFFSVVTEESPLTTGTKTKLQETEFQARELVNNVGKLLNTLKDPEKTGLVGFAGWVKGISNLTAAQISGDFFSEDRSTFEQQLKTIRQSALRVVSDESRFSEADRNFIFELFPQTGVLESRENALVKTAVLSAFFLSRLEDVLERSNVDTASIPSLTPDDIRDFYNKGLLERKEAESALQKIFGFEP